MLYSDHKSGKSRMGVFTKYIRGIVITALIFVLIFPVQTYAKGRKIDIIVFAGQSNMMGHGNAKTATKIKKKTGYSYLPVTAPEEISAFKEPFGRNENDDYFNNIMNGENYSTGSLVSSFIKSYNAKTNTRVLAVPAAMMGTGSYSWAEYRYKGIISRVNEAKEAAEDAGY
ncbi:MAG: hypothetical protein J5842_05655, partial [Lachnospiraceae bacterium]|nr:hypothetical protein [Lachnospiraceae bacterium]